MALWNTPERICIDLLRDGQQAHPQARALNYVRVGSAAGNEVTLHDELTGETLTVQPQLVINAAGPWIDFANADIGAPSQYIGGTKGSHLVLDHPQLREAIGDHEFFFENDDGRIVLIFPLRDLVMIGTSDLPIDNPDNAVCTDDEVDYFFGMIDRIFPDIATPARTDRLPFLRRTPAARYRCGQSRPNQPRPQHRSD
jgi:glycerol-3-phosphate dehydrogenase